MPLLARAWQICVNRLLVVAVLGVELGCLFFAAGPVRLRRRPPAGNLPRDRAGLGCLDAAVEQGDQNVDCRTMNATIKSLE